MPKYVLLLHDAPDAYSKLSPEQMQRVIEKYVASISTSVSSCQAVKTSAGVSMQCSR